ncbi:MAG: hypothetical protein ACK5TR_08150 [Alphaproteobacteria bacterium]|jgi:hypothetical protein|nr:hypothetical protein [Alphaproteobacteria bacterium]
MKKIFKRISILSVMATAVWGVNVSASRTVSEYLEERGNAPKIMAIGEGHAYNNYDSTFYQVDCESSANPDLEDDVVTQGKLSTAPEASFDKILLCNIPTTVFNGEIENGTAVRTERGLKLENPHLVLNIFKGLARLLKDGGTLEFNYMWGGNFAENDEHKAQLHGYLVKGLLNPFNQWLTKEDFDVFNDEHPRFEAAYTAQLKEFFQNAGFSDCVMTQRNVGGQAAQKPYNVDTFVTHPGWFVVTK